MKAYEATYNDARPKADNVSQSLPHLTVGAASMRAAAAKAEEQADSGERGELIRLELTDKVIL